MKVNHNEIFKYYQQGIYPSYEKVYAFGDIHGDFNAFVLVLKNAKLIDNDFHWIGGKAHVVQVGDILDRKIRETEFTDEDSEFKIISLILKLQLESYVAGGGFHPVIGNHEIMNILGIFDYVSPMGIKHFDNGLSDREKYFRIGGDFCKYLACGWNPIVKIGNYLFCHGGINNNVAKKYSIEDINYIMRDTLYGNINHLNQEYFQDMFLKDDSILWNREFSAPNMRHPMFIKNNIYKVLQKYNAKHMVVGHTPQDGGVKLKYDNKIICIDTGMSEAFGKKKNKTERIHFIEINSNKNKMIIY